MNCKLNFKLIAIFLLALSSVNECYAYTDEVTHGQLQLTTEFGQQVAAPLIDTQVNMQIGGLSARVKVKQTFKNDSSEWMEGEYLFPLPEKSAVDALTMQIGERLIIGTIKEKEQAKKIYQAAKISGKKASLLAQKRPNLFTNSVANIGPFETLTITIEYQQELEYHAQNGLTIRFPLAITERYNPQSILHESFTGFEQGWQSTAASLVIEDTSRQIDSQLKSRVKINVDLEAGFPLETLQSQSHKLSRQQVSETRHKVALINESLIADRDFILNWKPVKGAIPRAALYKETIGKDEFVNLLLLPPQDMSGDNAINREVIFVIDTSGSMAGESIEQAKEALLFGLDTLKDGDSFNIIEFNSRSHSLYQQAEVLDSQSLAQAKGFVKRLNAEGGTEMMTAMRLALNTKSKVKGEANKVRQVVFLTDGAISNEAQLFAYIESQVGDSRLFTVGIGSAPNSFFMKRAAAFGRGSYTFVANLNEAKMQIQNLFSSISQPQLSHINIKWPDATLVEMWPKKIPDLFKNQPLWIKAKISVDVSQSEVANLKNLEISGRLSSQEWQTQVDISGGAERAGVAKLWAREKIAGVMNAAHHGKLTAKARQELTQLALTHQLVSRFTSLVAVEKTPSRQLEPLAKFKAKPPTPKGSKQISYPKTALINDWKAVTPWLLLLSLLFFLVFLRRV